MAALLVNGSERQGSHEGLLLPTKLVQQVDGWVSISESEGRLLRRDGEVYQVAR